MSPSQTSLRGFLLHAKSTLQTAISKSDKVTLVIGNESCDLDSLTSSILFAYYRSLSPPAKAFSKVYIPLLNIPQRDLKLRPEFILLYPIVDIEAKHLITLDDLPGPARLKPENTRWILVDHNALQGELGASYGSRVGGVIDHHDEENAVPVRTDPEPRIVEKCGSCTSLVTAYCRDAWKANHSQSGASSGSDAEQGIDQESLNADDSAASRVRSNAQIARFGLASILIDTTNLKSQEKTTDKDREIVSYLESKIRADPEVGQGYSRDGFFQALQDAKENIGALSFNDILRKDYKQWTEEKKGGGRKVTLGISSVVKSMSFLLEKAQNESVKIDDENPSASTIFLALVREFVEQKGLDVFAIMTTSHSLQNEFQRELFLCTRDKTLVHQLQEFEARATLELGLEACEGDGIVSGDKSGWWTRTWMQRDVGKSRKQVAPLLRRSLE